MTVVCGIGYYNIADGDNMVLQLIAFSIFMLIEFALEYKFVLLIDFPIICGSRIFNGQECGSNYKPSITRGTVVHRCIFGIYTVISIVLAVVVYVFCGEDGFGICAFVVVFIHLLFHLTIAILRRKYDKEPHRYKKSKWL